MSEAFGSDYLTIEDEDGNEFELEVLDEFELDGQSYLAALPPTWDEDDPDFRHRPAQDHRRKRRGALRLHRRR